MRTLTICLLFLLCSCSSQNDQSSQQDMQGDAGQDSSSMFDADTEADRASDGTSEPVTDSTFDALVDTSNLDVVGDATDVIQDDAVSDAQDQDVLPPKNCKIVKTDKVDIHLGMAYSTHGIAASDKAYIFTERYNNDWLVNVYSLDGDLLWTLPVIEYTIGDLNFVSGSTWGFIVSANSGTATVVKLDPTAASIQFSIQDQGIYSSHSSGGLVLNYESLIPNDTSGIRLTDVSNLGEKSNTRIIYSFSFPDGANINGIAKSGTSTGVLFQPFNACCGNPWMEQRMLLLIENAPSSVVVVDYGTSDPQGPNKPSTFMHIFPASSGFLVHWLEFNGMDEGIQYIDEISYQGTKINSWQIPTHIIPTSLEKFGDGYIGLLFDQTTKRADIVVLNKNATFRQIIPTPYQINETEPQFIKAKTAAVSQENAAVAFCQGDDLCDGVIAFVQCF